MIDYVKDRTTSVRSISNYLIFWCRLKYLNAEANSNWANNIKAVFTAVSYCSVRIKMESAVATSPGFISFAECAAVVLFGS